LNLFAASFSAVILGTQLEIVNPIYSHRMTLIFPLFSLVYVLFPSSAVLRLVSTLFHRLNDLYKRYPFLFWLIGLILSLLSLLRRFLGLGTRSKDRYTP